MKSNLSALMAIFTGATKAFGGNVAAFAQANEIARNTHAATRRSRPSKARAKKFCAAAYGQPAPWLPNVKGTRFEKGVRVAR